ncbi:MAG: hypothetical protein GX308_02970 [Epulopiscium sp.]|nr:hypothetical protein [Candidatus Epulonipiscium sp.]
MIHLKNLSRISIAIIAALVLSSTSIIIANPKEDVFSQTEEKLTTIDEKEKEVLQKLFFILQDIEEMERQEEEIQKDIKTIQGQIQHLTPNIQREKISYERKKMALKEVLSIYQKRGVTSYLEILLASENLSSLVKRINIIRDLSKNTGNLLEELDEKRKILEEEKKELDDTLYTLGKKQEELLGTLIKNKKLRDDMQEYLTTLDSERSYYEGQLNQIANAWNKARTALSDSVSKFFEVLEKGDLPFEKVDIKITLGGVRASIDEITFNEIAKEYLVDKDIRFCFSKDKMLVEVPSTQFSLSGSFVIVDDYTLEFRAEEGTFYGMSLTKESIHDIFKNGHLRLNLKPVLYGGKLDKITIKEGALEISSKLPLF